MDTETALAFLDEASSRALLSRNDHIKVVEAVKILAIAISPKPTSKKTK